MENAPRLRSSCLHDQSSSVGKAMAKTKRPQILPTERERPKVWFRVLKIMQLWMEKYKIERDWIGRPRSLVIFGDLIQHSGEVGVCRIGGESDFDELRLVPKENFSWSNAYRHERHEVDDIWFAGRSY